MNMKKVVMVIIAAVALTTTHAQKISSSKVPSVVTSAFKKMNPDVKSVSWEIEDGTYEANYKKNGMPSSSNYDKNGNLIESEVEIKVKDLPVSVPDYIKTHYKSGIKEASKITKSNGEVNYEAMVNNVDVIFDANGKYLKEVKEETEAKEKKQ
jgi:hypothetical protein